MKLKEQSTKGICAAEIFKAKLADKPLQLSGMWPPSTDIDARTDIAIALVKNGYLKYSHPGAGAVFTIGDYPIQLGGGRTQMPGEPFKITWIDYDRIENELGIEET